MRAVFRIAVIVCALALSAPFGLAGGFEADTEGPWVNVDVIDLVE